MTWIAQCMGNGWDTQDTGWYGTFKSKKQAQREMMARFPEHASKGWHVHTEKMVKLRKLVSE